MKYNKTTIGEASSRCLLLLLFVWLHLFSASCKKERTNDENPHQPQNPLKLPHGNAKGEIVELPIGTAGGTLTSKDGTMKIEVPAGALDATTTFSIQEVENVLKNKGRSYRLSPENLVFKKPIFLTYYYGDLAMDGLNPDFLFLAYQDKDGYFYSANKTKGNREKRTLSIQTTHFSDWTFYSQYDLHFPNHSLVNGELRLIEGEEAVIALKATPLDKYDGEYSQIKLTELASGNYIQQAIWDYAPKKGVMNLNPAQASVTYKAPAKVDVTERVYINVTINGNLGTDNLGNKVQQMQIRQPVVVSPEGYFILTENGTEMSSTDFSGIYIHVLGSELVANFPNGYNMSCYIYGGIGDYPYNEHGVPGGAVIALSMNGKDGMMTFRARDCDKGGALAFSPGSLKMKSFALKKGEYFEGEFSATLYGYEFCQNARTKSLSGKFKFKKQ